MVVKTTQLAPRGLSDRSRRLWRDLVAAYDFQPHEHELLVRALEQNDLADQCARTIRRDGLQVDGKAHPLVAVQRDALQTSARYWRQLKFKSSGEQARRPGRPGGENWSAARKAGQAAHLQALGGR